MGLDERVQVLDFSDIKMVVINEEKIIALHLKDRIDKMLEGENNFLVFVNV
jgi:hypothetical protein